MSHHCKANPRFQRSDKSSLGIWNGDRRHYPLATMNMDNNLFKNYWFWVVVILVVGILFFYLPMPGFDKPAQLTIKFNDGNVRTFEGPVEGDMTILQALLSASRGGDFDVKYSLNGNNVNLASIGNVVNGPKEWHFYLNGQEVRTADIGTTQIKRGDLIEARYE